MSAFSAQPIVIDGKGHLLGRLASVVAKQVSVSENIENIKRVESWRHVFAQYGEGRASCGRGDKSGEEIF